jgi:serine/threonine protein kinase
MMSSTASGVEAYLTTSVSKDGLRFIRELGRGNYGCVHLAETMDGKLVAVKKIAKKTSADDGRIQKEVEAMSQLQHPNIIKLIDSYETEHTHCIVMQYAPKGDLLQLALSTKRIEESKARIIIRQLLEAVAYAHSHGWIHRDIKLENILLDENENVLLGDWGFATRWSQYGFLRESIGSLHYASPEIVSSCSYRGPEVDCWSVGVVLYSCVVGAFPFGDNVEAILNANYHLPSYVSKECAALIAGLLRLNPAARLTAKEALQSPFLMADESAPQTRQRSGSELRSRPILEPLQNTDDSQKQVQSLGKKVKTFVTRALDRFNRKSAVRSSENTRNARAAAGPVPSPPSPANTDRREKRKSMPPGSVQRRGSSYIQRR